MPEKTTYVGIHNDLYGGMTHLGGVVKDAWAFGLIPETETCAGWSIAQMQMLYDKVSDRWSEYGYRVSELPDEIRARHERIHSEALARAREQGWTAPIEDE